MPSFLTPYDLLAPGATVGTARRTLPLRYHRVFEKWQSSVVRREYGGRLGAGRPDVKQEVRDALQGHGENGVSAQYGTGIYRKTLDEAMKKVDYQDLDLSHLILRS